MSDSEEDKKKLDDKQMKLKKENSYTYWVKEDPNWKNAKIDIVPQKIEKIEDKEKDTKDSHSAWNTAGTWEEKKIPIEKVEKLIEENLVGFKTKDGKIEIRKVNSVTGEAHMNIVRGKKLLGFHIKITVKFEGLGALNDGKGKLKITEYTDDGDRSYELSELDGVSKDACAASVKSNIESIYDAILEILNKLKE